MLQPAVSLLIVFYFGCCKAEPNANLRLRISAKILDVLIDTIANKGKRFDQYADYPTRIEGEIGDVQYQLDPDTNTVELSLQLSDLNVYEDHLHRIVSANFSLGIQIKKNPANGELKLVWSRCNFTATPNTNSLEIPYLIGSLQDQVCRMLQAQLKFYQSRTLHTEYGVVHTGIACRLVEPSGVFRDRIEVTLSCNATVRNKIGETTTIEAIKPLPPLPMFEADQATVEIQASSASLHEAALVAIRPIRMLSYSVTHQSKTPLFTQIVPILSQIAVATVEISILCEYPILKLAVGFSNFSINSSHEQIKLAIDEKIITYRDDYIYPQDTILHCSIDLKMTIHTAFTSNQVAEEFNSSTRQLLTNDYQVFLQDSAIILKVDYGKLIPMMFGGNGLLF